MHILAAAIRPPRQLQCLLCWDEPLSMDSDSQPPLAGLWVGQLSMNAPKHHADFCSKHNGQRVFAMAVSGVSAHEEEEVFMSSCVKRDEASTPSCDSDSNSNA